MAQPTLVSKGSITLQKKMVDNRRKMENNNVPDLTDFMNDMFFGTVDNDKKAYNLTGGGGRPLMDEEDDFDDSTRSNSSRLTQEWLEEAKRMVASSPSRSESPSRLVGSPRFAAAQARLSVSSIDRRDPLSRHRAGEGFSGQILSKSEKHARNKSLTFDTSTTLSSESEQSPADASTPRRSRFKTDNSAPHPQGTPVPSRRTFKTASGDQYHHHCHWIDPLSPPKNLVESAHRRSVSRSTCFVEKGVPISNENGWSKEEEKSRDLSLNGFLKEQRIKIEKILNRESDYKAKIVLPGPSNSTSSMVAAICYAWLLENRLRKNKGSESNAEKYVAVPVMNIDLESLMMTGKLNIVVVGQDVLRTNGEAGSQCTILTDNYCEDAYDLLQTPMLKTILSAFKPCCLTRFEYFFMCLMIDGLETKAQLEDRVPERRSTSTSKSEATTKFLHKSPNGVTKAKNNKTSSSPAKPNSLPAKATATAPPPSRGKNGFFLAKWFGFGSK
ncbi:hypothetical protein Patl1_18147 [Pistacia atlantica]|uniref:Uncharacterized protein n=1 Tax=Pistacia atlantica TaxID=434234 RepID=A0ACC1BYV1_9ROSI|nr:hypothetical protein Patl1_18147 [Pistacia atlantica]